MKQYFFLAATVFTFSSFAIEAKKPADRNPASIPCEGLVFPLMPSAYELAIGNLTQKISKYSDEQVMELLKQVYNGRVPDLDGKRPRSFASDAIMELRCHQRRADMGFANWRDALFQ